MKFQSTRNIRQEKKEFSWRVGWRVDGNSLKKSTATEMNTRSLQLHMRYKDKPWFSSVGVADDRLIVYTNRRLTISERDEIPMRFRDVRVDVVELGEFKAL